MNKLLTTLIVFLTMFSSNTYAAWTSQGEVVEVMSHNGAVVLRTKITDSPCGGAGSFWWPTTDDDSKDMLSIALAAMMAGKKVAVVYIEGAANCNYGSSALMTHIRVYNS